MSSNRSDVSKSLSRLIAKPANIKLSAAEKIVFGNRRLIRKAMRQGHDLATISRELSIGKSTLQKYLGLAGLFFRKPRKRKGVVIRPNRGAISRAKNAALANV